MDTNSKVLHQYLDSYEKHSLQIADRYNSILESLSKLESLEKDSQLYSREELFKLREEKAKIEYLFDYYNRILEDSLIKENNNEKRNVSK